VVRVNFTLSVSDVSCIGSPERAMSSFSNRASGGNHFSDPCIVSRFSIHTASFALISPILQLHAHELMASLIGSHVGYLTRKLRFHSNLTRNNLDLLADCTDLF